MALGDIVFYDHGLEFLSDGTIDFDDDTLVAMLVSAGYSPSQVSDSAWSDIATHETSAPGYASAVLTTSISRNVQTSQIKLKHSDATYSSNGVMDAKYIVYATEGGSLLAYQDLDTSVTAGIQATAVTVSPDNSTMAAIGVELSRGEFRFGENSVAVDEGDSVTLHVRRVNGSDDTVSVRYDTTEGSASAGVNYVSAGSRLTFADGVLSASFTISTTLVGFTGTDDFTVDLSSPEGGATISSPSSVTITVVGSSGGGGGGYTVNRYAAADADGTGDGTSASSPWTMAQALANAQPGDVVQFAPGTYVTTGTDSNEPVWAVPSGTSGNNIVFVAENPSSQNLGTGDTVRSVLTNNGSGGSIIGSGPGAGGADYFILDGFDFPDYQGTDADGAFKTTWFGCSNIKIRRCTTDEESMGTSPFNHGFIFCDRVEYLEVYDCIMKNNTGEGENASSIMFYGTTHADIYYNTFEGNHTGIFIKGEGTHGKNGYIDVRYNRFINNNDVTISIGGHQETDPEPAARSYIRNNLFYNNYHCVEGNQYSTWFSYITIENNTVYESTGSPSTNGSAFFYFSSNVTAGNTGNIVRNNIISTVGAVWLGEDSRAISSVQLDANQIDVDYNIIYNETYLYFGTPNVTDFSTWQSTYNHDENGTHGVDPQFISVDPSNADFLKLQTGSVAEGAASDGDNAGAFETGDETIGPRTTPVYS